MDIRTQLNDMETKGDFSAAQGGHHVYIFGSTDRDIQRFDTREEFSVMKCEKLEFFQSEQQMTVELREFTCQDDLLILGK